MPTDLYERLADYRVILDEAIVADLASRDATRTDPRPSPRGRLAVAASVTLIVAGGVGALAWANADRSTSPTDPRMLGTRGTSSDATATTPTPDSIPEPGKVVSPSETEAPNSRIDQLAVGDSVMVGAAQLLADQGFTVDAIESRMFQDVLALTRTLRDDQRLGSVVVIQLGNNGLIDPDDLPQLMDTLAEVPHVLLLTIDVPTQWSDPNNALIRQAASIYPNVSVLDWEALNDSCAGSCFYDDGFHLRPDGQQYYVDLIAAAINER